MMSFKILLTLWMVNTFGPVEVGVDDAITCMGMADTILDARLATAATCEDKDGVFWKGEPVRQWVEPEKTAP